MTVTLRPIDPLHVIRMAAEAGVPNTGVPALAQLWVDDGRRADGWLSTASGPAPLSLEVGDASPWPVGQLDLIGAMVAQAPAMRERPYLNLQDSIISVYVASLVLPNGSASADIAWSRGAASSAIRFRFGKWTTRDGEAACSALRWLETLPRLGGQRAMSDAEAFQDAVRHGLEWLQDNPGAEPRGFTREELRRRRCVGPDAIKQWMRDKHFGIRDVQRELERQFRRPE